MLDGTEYFVMLRRTKSEILPESEWHHGGGSLYLVEWHMALHL